MRERRALRKDLRAVSFFMAVVVANKGAPKPIKGRNAYDHIV
jgi:hypothetical protein